MSVVAQRQTSASRLMQITSRGQLSAEQRLPGSRTPAALLLAAPSSAPSSRAPALRLREARTEAVSRSCKKNVHFEIESPVLAHGTPVGGHAVSRDLESDCRH
jgi:hypothetical protein